MDQPKKRQRFTRRVRRGFEHVLNGLIEGTLYQPDDPKSPHLRRLAATQKGDALRAIRFMQQEWDRERAR